MARLNATNSLWDEALKTLPENDRAVINTSTRNKSQILHDILCIVEEKKAICLRKRWKYKKGNEIIIIRDQLDKITAWVQRFKDAAVLVLLQCATNDSQTFGAMVDGIERVSQVLPRCSILEEAYLKKLPLSPTQFQLQLPLTKLYISILRYLVVATNYFSTSTPRLILKSTVSTPEHRVQCYLDIVSKRAVDVDSCLLVIQSEVNQNLDGKTTKILECLSELQKPMIRSSAQISDLWRILSREERNRIYLWLSQIRNSSHHQLEGEGYLPGSGSWLFKRAEYKNWRNSSSSVILWLHGIPGCGKTKLIYNIVQKFIHENSSSSNPAPLAYFYCARNPAEPARSKPGEILRSLLKQLAFNSQGKLKDVILQEFRRRDREAELEGGALAPFSVSEAKELIIALLEHDPVTIVIDALDECDPLTRHELLSVLDVILQNSSSVVKIIVSSRDDGDLSFHLANSPNVYIRASENGHDIERFINHSLLKAVSSRRLLSGRLSPGLQAEVLNTLKKKAQGMFRWAAMQIDSLCNNKRIKIENDVRRELGKLPQSLRESYTRNYQRVLDLARPNRVIAQRVFKWLLCAQKLMNANELIAAVTFVSEHHVLATENILDICCGMIVLDDYGHFRFAHLSVREYLESLDAYCTTQCHSFILQRCLETYHNTSVDSQIQQQNGSELELKPYAMLYWPFHCKNAGDPKEDKELAIITKAFIFTNSIGNHNNEVQGPMRFNGAFTDWLHDAWNASQYSGVGDYDNTVLSKLESAAGPLSTPQFLASIFDFVWILEIMETSGWNDWNLLNYREQSCISIAAKWNNTATILWILDKEYADSDAMDAALPVAIDRGQADIAMLLAEHGASGFAKPPEQQSALYNAVSIGHLNLTKIILQQAHDFDPYVFADAMCHSFLTSLETLFPLFWDTCTQLDAPSYFRVLLYVQMHSDSDERIFDDPGELNDLYEKIFHYTITSGAAEINQIRRLWELDPDLFLSLRIFTDEALHCNGIRAVRDNIYDMVVQVYKKNDDEAIGILLSLDAFDSEYALLFSCYHSGEVWHSFARFLLNRGVDVNAVDKKGRTPLILVIKMGNLERMELLLESGAAPEQTDNEGQSALVHALRNENMAAVAALDDRGININIPVLRGQTPLQYSLSMCDHSMVGLLRICGARRPEYTIAQNGVYLPFLATVECKICAGNLLRCTFWGKNSYDSVFDGALRTTSLFPVNLDSQSTVSCASTGSSDGEQDFEQMSNTFASNTKWNEDGLTLLQAAICVADPNLVREFLKIPVNVNALDNQGFSALHYAAVLPSFSSNYFTGMLLSHNANPSIKDRNGCTPLHLAVSAASLGSITLLVKAMAPRVDVMDHNGKTALHLAILSQNMDVISQLLSAGVEASPQDFIEWDELFSRFTGSESIHDVFSDTHRLCEKEETDDSEFTTPLIQRGPEYQVENTEEEWVTDVDLYFSHDSEIWTPLNGRRTSPLRPVYAPFRV